MRQSAARSTRKLVRAEPAWEIAHLFPAQGQWSEEEYLALDSNRLVEFSDGFIEVLPVPTTTHQLIAGYLYELIIALVREHSLGMVLFAGIRIRLWPAKYRQPDIVFMHHKHEDRIGEEYWDGADLAIEVVSRDTKDRHHDLVTKRREYARAGIGEYWIVDPQKERITVLRLQGKRYLGSLVRKTHSA